MFQPAEITETLEGLNVTHVIWVPDSTFGPWEGALEASARLRLLRVCREGEAWPLAAGLHLGGKTPLIVMQSTGFFESGDSLRSVLFDLDLPLFALIGGRNLLRPTADDSAKDFVEPLLAAWRLNWVGIRDPAEKPRLAAHFRECQRSRRHGIVLLAEGAG